MFLASSICIKINDEDFVPIAKFALPYCKVLVSQQLGPFINTVLKDGLNVL
ncbi:hypothetical protein LCGT_0966 [Lactococcus garvieae ATCC 49156]|uniref:Uncharacterized protein n=1 Tax=Lactococcus garvieae (strain Lg2) TaxID=420890 RepID=F9VDY3_LACGL|nr:hypothetical protein LCGT_0966 [Lactococcus garvieae ATCC 49156]BAK60534.1 hypothetical protein LCGL_1074 [Lactococcus garvieae Lg2]